MVPFPRCLASAEEEEEDSSILLFFSTHVSIASRLSIRSTELLPCIDECCAF